MTNLIGPYNEYDKLILVCEVSGGKPRPLVTWWRESVLVDDSFKTNADGKVINELEIPSLSRYDLMAVYTCQSSNNNISIPVSSDVTIDLNCKSTFRLCL